VCDLDSGSTVYDNSTRPNDHSPSKVRGKNFPNARRRSNSCSSLDVMSLQQQLSANHCFDISVLDHFSSNESLPSASNFLTISQHCTGSGAADVASQFGFGDRSLSDEEEELLPLFKRLALNVQKSGLHETSTPTSSSLRLINSEANLKIITEQKKAEYQSTSSFDVSSDTSSCSRIERERQVLPSANFGSGAVCSISIESVKRQECDVSPDTIRLRSAKEIQGNFSSGVSGDVRKDTKHQGHFRCEINYSEKKGKGAELFTVFDVGSVDCGTKQRRTNLEQCAASILSNDVLSDVIILDDSIAGNHNSEMPLQCSVNEMVVEESSWPDDPSLYLDSAKNTNSRSLSSSDITCSGKRVTELQSYSNSDYSSHVACSEKDRSDYSRSEVSSAVVCNLRNEKELSGHSSTNSSTNSICCSKTGDILENHSASNVGGRKVKPRRAKLKQRVKSILSDDVFSDIEVSNDSNVKSEAALKCSYEGKAKDFITNSDAERQSRSNSDAGSGYCTKNERAVNSGSDISGSSNRDFELGDHAAFICKKKKISKVLSGSSIEGCGPKQKREKLKKRVALILTDVFDDSTVNDAEAAMNCTPVANKENKVVDENRNKCSSKCQRSNDAMANILTYSNSENFDYRHQEPVQIFDLPSSTSIAEHISSANCPTPWSARHIGNFDLETSILDDSSSIQVQKANFSDKTLGQIKQNVRRFEELTFD